MVGPLSPSRQKVDLIGLPLDVVSRGEFVDSVIQSLDSGSGGWCCTVNLDIFRQWTHSAEIRELLSGVTDFVADGTPILWAARVRGVKLPGRVCGSDLIYDLTEAAARSSKSVYLLGGNPGMAEKAGETLRQKYPGLRVAGTACPEFGFERSPETMKQLIDDVVAGDPDIVYVGLGFPKQERLIHELKKHHPRAWYLGIGISFSFVSGEVSRAPGFMQSLGMEWFHRMLQEPGRLWKRYIIHDLPFLATVIPRLILERPKRA